jgi:signal-transduction protein with cAMP-binding, CBS, and nucleotidyltransferase domain
MERVLVPKNTLLIRRGDNPDYLYVILEGEIAVYIDPNEYVFDDAGAGGKHASIDISLNNKSKSSSSRLIEGERGFKQSYVLNLRKSIFSMYNETNNTTTTLADMGEDELVGQVLSLVRESERFAYVNTYCYWIIIRRTRSIIRSS